METKPTLERDDTITPEDESLQIISIRKLDRLEAFEDGDVAGVVRTRGAVMSGIHLCLQRHARALSCPFSIGGRTVPTQSRGGLFTCVTDTTQSTRRG